jgi:hypothetical protein
LTLMQIYTESQSSRNCTRQIPACSRLGRAKRSHEEMLSSCLLREAVHLPYRAGGHYVTRVGTPLANDMCSREEASGRRWPKRAFSLPAAGWRCLLFGGHQLREAGARSSPFAVLFRYVTGRVKPGNPGCRYFVFARSARGRHTFQLMFSFKVTISK